MPCYFFDSSALVKRYVQEHGTAWVVSVLDPAAGNSVFVARLTGVEVIAAIARRSRAGGLPPTSASIALRQFRREFQRRWRVVGIFVGVVHAAMELAERYGLRAYDAVQLAAALRVKEKYDALREPITMVSADGELNTAARAEGLNVEDPNQHP
jgi:uncharacterized protein